MKSSPRMLIVLQDLFRKHGLSLEAPGSCLSLINEPWMPLSIEVQYKSAAGLHITMCHYYIQEGDWMDDPRIDYLWVRHEDDSPLSPGLYPIWYENDGMGIYQELVTFGDHGQPVKYIRHQQGGAADFAQMWALNLREQGFNGDDVVVKNKVDGREPEEDWDDETQPIEITEGE